MRGRPILPALDGLQGSLTVTRLTLHSTADFPPSCGKLFTTHSAVLGSFHWAGRTAFEMREPASFVNIFPAPYRSHEEQPSTHRTIIENHNFSSADPRYV